MDFLSWIPTVAKTVWDWVTQKPVEAATVVDTGINLGNFAQQQRAYADQQALNSIQMQREDNAVQRRVADLKAAGLSPTLAAGSAAGASPLHVNATPQYSGGGMMQRMLDNLNIQQQRNAVETSAAEKELRKIQAMTAYHDYNVIKDTPFKSTDPWLPRMTGGIYNKLFQGNATGGQVLENLEKQGYKLNLNW